jgi:hypothetical protein
MAARAIVAAARRIVARALPEVHAASGPIDMPRVIADALLIGPLALALAILAMGVLP